MTIPDASPAPSPVAPIRPKTSFAGDVMKLVSGTTIAQLIGILASPILTRLYAPEAFGALALFTSITSILGVIACLRYELAIMLPESDEDAANLLGVSLLSALLIALLTVPVIWWGRDLLLGWLNAPELAPYLWMVPPFVFLTGVFLALNYWNSRTKRFGRLSIARVSRSVATTSTQLGFGFAGYATGGTMIGASVGGHTLATAVLGGQIWRDDRKLFLRSINWRGMLTGIERHRKFPLYGTWSSLLNTVSWQLPAFLLAAFFSPTVVGYYALGFRILQMPMNLIGNSIGQVFYQRAAEAKVQGTLTETVETTLRALIAIGVFPLLVLSVLGRDLFGIIFGPQWAMAGVYVQILSPWAVVWFVSSPLSTIIIVRGRQDLEFKLSVLSFVGRLSALVAGGLLSNALLTIALFAMSGIIIHGYLCFVVTTMVRIPVKDTIWLFVREILAFAPFGIGMLIVSARVSAAWVSPVLAALTLAWYLWKLASSTELKTLFPSVPYRPSPRDT